MSDSEAPSTRQLAEKMLIGAVETHKPVLYAQALQDLIVADDAHAPHALSPPAVDAAQLDRLHVAAVRLAAVYREHRVTWWTTPMQMPGILAERMDAVLAVVNDAPAEKTDVEAAAVAVVREAQRAPERLAHLTDDMRSALGALTREVQLAGLAAAD